MPSSDDGATPRKPKKQRRVANDDDANAPRSTTFGYAPGDAWVRIRAGDTHGGYRVSAIDDAVRSVKESRVGKYCPCMLVCNISDPERRHKRCPLVDSDPRHASPEAPAHNIPKRTHEAVQSALRIKGLNA